MSRDYFGLQYFALLAPRSPKLDKHGLLPNVLGQVCVITRQRFQHDRLDDCVGTADGRLDGGIVRVTVDDGTLHVVDVPDEGEFFVAIDPRNVTLSLDVPAGSAQNVFQGEVEEVTPTLPGGETVRVQLKSNPPLVAEVTRHAAEKMGLAPGVHIHAAVKATAITTYQ